MEEVRNYLINKFFENFKKAPVDFFVSPGRLEVIGNHTDHNHGLALVASASLYIKGAVNKNEANVINLISEGSGEYQIDAIYSEPNEEFYSSTESLIKGIVSGFISRGYQVGGFDAYLISEVLPGSGISSSAAFELMICEILNYLYNDDSISKVELAKIAQMAERDYFGKPCGLLDQIGCASGGISYVDFANPIEPKVKNTKFPFDVKIVLTNPGGNHEGLTSYYASIPLDMKKVASSLGKEFLRETKEEDFVNLVNNNPHLLGEREIARAHHFYDENKRVNIAFNSLKENDLSSFLKAINERGLSSSTLLMNTQVPGKYANSPERALEIARKVAPKSAHRVHGGGFMGTIISFVNKDEYEPLVNAMKETFGKESVIDVSISPYGASKIE